MTRHSPHLVITSSSSLTWRHGAFGLGLAALSSVLSACSEGPPVYASGGTTASGGAAAGGAATSGGAAAGGAATSGGAASGGAATSGGAAAGGSGSGGESTAGGSAAGGGGNSGGSAAGGGGNSGGSAAGGGDAGPAFAEVETILNMKCGTMMCHGGTMPKGGLNFSSANTDLHGTLTTPKMIEECGNANLVVASDADASAIVKLIVGTECMKNNMAFRMPGQTPLPQGEIDTIKAWIEAGAKEE